MIDLKQVIEREYIEIVNDSIITCALVDNVHPILSKLIDNDYKVIIFMD